MSEFTKLGGYLIEGQPEVAHDNTLSGNGLEGNPLGLSEQVSEANDLVHSNSGTWNGVSAKLDTTASANFYTTANESGFISEVPTGTMNESAFGYDSDNKISSYNGSAIGGSAPTYGYTDNNLISAIDTSGLYATSAGTANKAISADALNKNGTMGGNIVQSSGSHNFYYMPGISPFGKPQGIYSPLQYATGACLAMAGDSLGAFYKGNEWFVSNTQAGQVLRGEVHYGRGVHLSGATTAGYGFNLAIGAVSGVNSTGSWKYGHAEDAALRAVSSCDMHESAFEYDASDNITAYNGSAFKAGDEFPQSATEAIETVTANSADWNATTDTVSSNSGAWGGSALPISAGPGVDIQLVDDTLVFSAVPQTGIYNETMLFSGSDAWGYGTIPLSESLKNFKRIKVLATRAYTGDGNTDRYSGPWSEFECDGIANTTAAWGAVTPAIYEGPFWKFSTFTANSTFTTLTWFEGGFIKVTNPSDYGASTAWNDGKSCGIKAVIGINRIAGGN
jgi:hypothetical protein